MSNRDFERVPVLGPSPDLPFTISLQNRHLTALALIDSPQKGHGLVSVGSVSACEGGSIVGAGVGDAGRLGDSATATTPAACGVCEGFSARLTRHGSQ